MQYGIAFRQNEADASGNYFVDHTSTLIGIDRSGSVRIVWGPDATPEEIADDLDALLDL